MYFIAEELKSQRQISQHEQQVFEQIPSATTHSQSEKGNC